MAKAKGLAEIAGQTVGEALAFAAGFAAARGMEPIGVALAQAAWDISPVRAPEAGTMASGVAQGQVDHDTAQKWARLHGYDEKAFAALVDVATTGPGVPAAFDLWRRNVIGEDDFRRAAKRQGIEAEWIDDLVKIKQNVLDAADLARGIHRGLIHDPGLLQGELPGGGGHVPAYPVYNVDALAEAEASGFDRDHLGVLVGLQGNPMGAHEAAEALFRGVLTRDDYLRAIAEGNTRNEWAQAILEQTRQIPTARDYLENALRGYTNLGQALDGAERHGMTRDDALLIYQNQGRPMALHQITTALARGGKFQPEQDEITDPYRASIVEGNLKPAYYDLAYANRYNYPSAVVLRALGAAGELTGPEIEDILLKIGWEPGFAAKVSALWGHPTAGKADPHVAKAQTHLWTALHTAYVKDEATDALAHSTLDALDVAATAQAEVLTLWGHERALVRAALTAAQIKKAIGLPGKDQAWAMDRLHDLGYTADDATTFLAE